MWPRLLGCGYVMPPPFSQRVTENRVSMLHHEIGKSTAEVCSTPCPLSSVLSAQLPAH